MTNTTHPYAGAESTRQAAGRPGHCEYCAEYGHVVTHPSYGCADVGCDADHPDLKHPDLDCSNVDRDANHSVAVALEADTNHAAACELLSDLPYDRMTADEHIAAAKVHAMLALCNAIRSLDA